jgi:hypothetical protein
MADVVKRIIKFYNALDPPNTVIRSEDYPKLISFLKSLKPPANINKSDYVMLAVIEYYKFVNDVKDQKINQVAQLLEQGEAAGMSDLEKLELLNKRLALSNTYYNIASILGMTSVEEIAKAINPQYKYKKAHVCLDTRYAEFLDNNTKLRWYYRKDLIDNNAPAIGNALLENIVSIRMGSFVIPFVNCPSKRITVFIEELNDQAFIRNNTEKFHFIGNWMPAAQEQFINEVRLEIVHEPSFLLDTTHFVPSAAEFSNCRIDFNMKNNDGIFYFNNIVTTLDSFTLLIKNDLERIQFPRINFDIIFEHVDLIGNIAVNSTNVDLINLENGGEIIIKSEFPHGHRYLPEDPDSPTLLDDQYKFIFSLRFIDFNTTEPELDKIFIQYMSETEFTTVRIIDEYRLKIIPRIIKPQTGKFNLKGIRHVVPNPLPPQWPLGDVIPFGDILPCKVILEHQRTLFSFEITMLDI